MRRNNAAAARPRKPANDVGPFYGELTDVDWSAAGYLRHELPIAVDRLMRGQLTPEAAARVAERSRRARERLGIGHGNLFSPELYDIHQA